MCTVLIEPSRLTYTMSHTKEIFTGDFVELVDKPEVRGYVMRSSPGSSHVVVIIDEFEGDCSPLLIPRCRVRLVRSDDQDVYIDMNDFLAAEYPCLGMAATTYADSEIRFKPDSAMASLPRPPAQELPGPHSSIINHKVFKSEWAQEVFNEVYAGRFLVMFYHSFWPQDMSQALSDEILGKANPQFAAWVYVPEDLALKADEDFSGASTHEASDGTVHICVAKITITQASKEKTKGLDWIRDGRGVTRHGVFHRAKASHWSSSHAPLTARCGMRPRLYHAPKFSRRPV